MLWRHSGLMPFDAVLLEKEGGDGGGGGGRGGPDIEATVRKILGEKDANQAVGELLKDNFKQREKIRDLERDLESNRVPEGGLALTADEAKAWAAYQELGKPEELQSGLKERDDLKEKVELHERKERVAEAASAASLNPEVLLKLPGSEKLRFEVKTEKVDGEDVPVAYVTEAEDGATPQKLTDYVDETWPEFKPALQAEEQEEKGGGGGTSFPPQRSKGASTKTGPASADDVQETKRKRRRYASL